MTIKREDLVRGQHYFGHGRFLNALALWDGNEFHGFTFKWGHYDATTATYGDQGFTPIAPINIPEELK